MDEIEWQSQGAELADHDPGITTHATGLVTATRYEQPSKHIKELLTFPSHHTHKGKKEEQEQEQS